MKNSADQGGCLVSFAAVIRVVTQQMGFGSTQPLVGEKHCVTTLITAANETRRVLGLCG